MPIQPMNTNQYEMIPDEDVTPMSRLITNKMKKSTKYRILMFTAIVFVLAIFAILAWRSYMSYEHTVRIYQTFMEQPTKGMLPVDMNSMPRLDSDGISRLSFGNIKCDDVQCPLNARLYVDSSKTYQEVIGFGGAFTEATAINYSKLPQHIKDKVIQLYFGADGIALTLGRISINSCDFSLQSYSFDDIAGDYDLLFFDTEVTHDNAYIIPLIRLAMETSSLPIKIVASPWSPPSWMKNPVSGSINSSILGSASPNGLKDDPQTKTAWARYISKFITAYRYKGVPIWAITPQNEPEFPAPWEACTYTSTYEKMFIEKYLGPQLRNDHPELKILAFDHNKDHLLQWTRTIISGDTEKYVDGMAFHWYGGADRITDGTYGYDSINASHHYAPGAILLATEGCSCPGVALHNWLRAERLGHDVMFDLQNYAQGWIDWNLLVDYQGGLNHLHNYCDASLVADEDFGDVTIQPKFYYLGHFSKFVLPGSVRISSSVRGDYGFQVMDPNAQAGLEVGLFFCEQSVRQMWSLDAETSTLRLSTLALTQDVTYPGKVSLCISQGNEFRDVLHIADCTDLRPTTKLLVVDINAAGQIRDKVTGLCVSLKGDVREPGALLELTECTPSSRIAAHQVFAYNTTTGLITAPRVLHDDELCVTAGWPFLTAVAFKTPNEKTAVVVMNEASADTSIALFDAARSEYLGFAIHGRAIQTITY